MIISPFRRALQDHGHLEMGRRNTTCLGTFQEEPVGMIEGVCGGGGVDLIVRGIKTHLITHAS